MGSSSGPGHGYDYAFKILLIGDSGVGKSSLLVSFISNHLADDLSPTIGVDFKIKHLAVGDEKLKLTIWDTAHETHTNNRLDLWKTGFFVLHCATTIMKLLYEILAKSGFCTFVNSFFALFSSIDYLMNITGIIKNVVYCQIIDQGNPRQEKNLQENLEKLAEDNNIICAYATFLAYILHHKTLERFRTLTSSYYRGSQGIILVYDVTKRETFTNLADVWVKEVELYSTNRNCVKVLVGNKVDKEADRMVTREEGIAFANEYGCLFIECSAKTRANVEKCFEELALKIMEVPKLVEEGSVPVKRNILKQKQEQHAHQGGCCS
ncbi:unnamed protein product [Musa acuminata subsp. burmannicoides]